MKKPVVIAALLSLLAAGCMDMSITRSLPPLRAAKTLALGGGVELTSWGAVLVHMNHSDLYPAAFRVTAPGLTVYVDPIGVDNPKPADLIFITHDHFDHLSTEYIRAVYSTNTLIICPAGAAASLKDYRTKTVKPGDALELPGLKCEVAPAYNRKPLALWFTAHPKSAGNAGYVLTVGGERIYFAGDTDALPENRAISNLAAAVFPIGGAGLTMGPDEAADFINALKPGVAVPSHYNVTDTECLEKFRRLTDTNIRIADLRPGNGTP